MGKRKGRYKYRSKLLIWRGCDPWKAEPARRDDRFDHGPFAKRMKYISWYDPDTDEIVISSPCRQKKAIWAHEMGHRVMHAVGHRPSTQHVCDEYEENMADVIGMALVGERRMMAVLETLKDAHDMEWEGATPSAGDVAIRKAQIERRMERLHAVSEILHKDAQKRKTF